MAEAVAARQPSTQLSTSVGSRHAWLVLRADVIIYSHREHRIFPVPVARDLLTDALALRNLSCPPHDRLVDLLVRFGELESAVVDALCPAEDDDEPIASQCRRAALALASAFVASWQDAPERARRALEEFVGTFAAVDLRAVRGELRGRVQEGYAYYAVYPEAYAEAAVRFWRERRPARVICVGIRTIGASLSATVGAALQSCGCLVESFTVRPHGYPFDRTLRIGPRLERRVRETASQHMAIVDEGPGLTGSTFVSVVTALRDLRHGLDGIVLFPSWPGDHRTLSSDWARAACDSLPLYIGRVDGLGLVDGRLASGEPATDVSAGQWRSHVFMRESEFPAVHPRHERLKYRTAGPARDLLRFAGLGPYGQLALVRAEALMDAGFGPSVHGLSRGFLRMSFLEGRPLRRNDVTRTLLERMAAYLAYLKRHCATGSPASPDGLREMVAANVADIFGCDRIPIVERVMNTVGRFTGAEAVAVDGRMLPHDWIASDAGFHKTDALDHHRDDFFPGHEDIAWDVAGACVEFDLDPKAREYLVSRYRWHARDPEIERRLPFYRLAYLAYRIGYVSMASADLPDTPDGGRFRQLTARYRAQLERFLLIAPSVR